MIQTLPKAAHLLKKGCLRPDGTSLVVTGLAMGRTRQDLQRYSILQVSGTRNLGNMAYSA